MKKILSILFLFALLASSCSEDELVRNQSSKSLKFTASFEENESRTYMGEGNLLRWTAGDQISLFVANALNQQYEFEGKTGANSGYFKKIGNSFGTGNDLNCHYAVYPYASDIEITESGVINATLPAEQNYAENSFGLGANTMVAVTQNTDDTFLKFKNVGGYLKLQLYGDNLTVKTITLTGNNNEKLAGKATITPSYGSDPIISMADEATATITLNCGDGVKIGSTAETATAFWIVVPPTTFEKGFTITVTDIDGGEFTQTTSNKILVERNVIKPMAALEVVILDKELEGEGGDLIPYITFTAEAGQSLKMSLSIPTLEYSVNNGEWTTLGTNTVHFGGEFGALRLRGKSQTGTYYSLSFATVKFGNSAPVACSGDIRTLVDYENYNTVDTSKAGFERLFKNCTSLTSAPELPATTLAGSCYSHMFEGCTSLVNAPKLPATTLVGSCYNYMFYNCKSLVNAPELPATTLTDCCYSYMFYNCTSLVNAPELPATTLAESCYENMFKGCTSLVDAPALPATTLAKSCYRDMFNTCTNLVNAPELPATTLTDWCYFSMFNGCTSLVNAPELPATTLTDWCYREMFCNCTSLVNAPELPATTMKECCYADMFSGCKSLVNAPALPATTLAESCYDTMFWQCSSLVKAPALPATTLVKSCYWQMFGHCTSLVEAPELPATAVESYCYGSMFGYCTSLVEAPKLPAMYMAEKCYSGMFKGCTSLVNAPELPATFLAKECYRSMFYECSGLVNAPELLPATTLAESCYYYMFNGCKSMVKAPVLPATTLATQAYYRMFYHCNKLNEITMLATDISASNAFTEWVASVASTGTFIKAASMESLSRGANGIPNGWTVKNYGEE